MIYIVIPVFNRWNYTKQCLISLSNQTNVNFKIVVIDHGSTDGTDKFIEDEFPSIILLKGDSSMWWTAATNMGVQYALTMKDVKFILTLNNDLVVREDYIQSLYLASMQQPNSIIGSVSLDVDQPEKIVYAGTNWNQFTAKYTIPVSIEIPYSRFITKYEFIKSDLLPGRGTLIPINVFSSIGLFDEVNFPHYVADEEFTLRANRAGFKIFVYAKAAVLSHVSLTGLKSPLLRKKSRLSLLKDSLISIRSSSNLGVRWKWARNAKFPLLHFSMDMTRLLASKLKKSISPK
jgi:GT2 family glycosyltransferase